MKKCKRFKHSSNGHVEVNLSRDSGDQHNSHGSDHPGTLYNVLNDHWRHQFEGYILEMDQVVIDPRPFSKGLSFIGIYLEIMLIHVCILVVTSRGIFHVMPWLNLSPLNCLGEGS